MATAWGPNPRRHRPAMLHPAHELHVVGGWPVSPRRTKNVLIDQSRIGRCPRGLHASANSPEPDARLSCRGTSRGSLRARSAVPSTRSRSATPGTSLLRRRSGRTAASSPASAASAPTAVSVPTPQRAPAGLLPFRLAGVARSGRAPGPAHRHPRQPCSRVATVREGCGWTRPRDVRLGQLVRIVPDAVSVIRDPLADRPTPRRVRERALVGPGGAVPVRGPSRCDAPAAHRQGWGAAARPSTPESTAACSAACQVTA
jgi:hypothetical protein